MREFNEDMEIALSGGGFRASAFGLGVLLYLAHSGLNRRVKCISSVSGGSITNGFVAYECDFGSLTNVEEFTPVASRLATKISGNGKFGGFWIVSRPYIAILVFSGVALLFWLMSIAVAVLSQVIYGRELRQVTLREWISFVGVALIWGVAGLCREYVVRWWISRTFFMGRSSQTLGSVSGRTVDHVFCATDLSVGSPFFFSTKGNGRVFSETYGRGDGKDVRLAFAVATSAALPPLIPPMAFKLASRFERDAEHPVTYLSDGGVWNNLGTDWSRLRSEVRTAETQWIAKARPRPGIPMIEAVNQYPIDGILLMANASMPDRRRDLWMVKIPVVSFLTTFSRVISVAVNSTVASRSTDVELHARCLGLGELGD